MGLLDGILKDVVGGLIAGRTGGGAGTGTGAQTQPSLLLLVFQLIQQSGGLQAILERLKQAGLTQQANSWVSTGDNLPVSGAQINQALGPDMLGQLGAGTGLSQDQLGDAIAQLLPNLVNEMTPEGQVPDNHQDLVSGGLAALLGGSR